MMMVKNYLRVFYSNASEKLALPIIATHEVFYLDKDMYEAHDAYLCWVKKLMLM